MGMGRAGTPGSAGLHLAAGVPLLHPGEQVFAAMLEGWRAQQLARNLALATAGRREAMVRAFAAHADAMPWAWGPQMLDEWLGELRGMKGLRRSTVRSYASSVSAFCWYVTDPRYGWAGQCESAVRHPPGAGVPRGEHRGARRGERGGPAQRALTRDELQAFFDDADEQVGRVRGGAAQGLAGGVPRRHAVQGDLRVGAAPPRGGDAGCGGLRRRTRPRAGVRRATGCAMSGTARR